MIHSSPSFMPTQTTGDLVSISRRGKSEGR